MFGLNPWEIALIVMVIVMLFGAKRVPEIARSFGKGVREFKSSVEGKEDSEATGEEASSEEKEPELAGKA